MQIHSITFYYNQFAISETVSLLQKQRVDVVTGLPLIELRDFYSKLIMPLHNLFSILSAPSCSDLRNPQSNMGHLIGSFFMINRTVLDKIGGFRCVQTSIQEDTDLGVCLKMARYPIVVIKINHLVSAFWSRNKRTLLEGIKRIVSYNLSNSRKNILIDTLAVFCLILAPFLLLPFVGNLATNQSGDVTITMTLYIWNILLCLLPILSVAMAGMTKYRLNPLYSFLILFGGGFFLTTYLTSIFQLVSLPFSRAIRWKGRGV
jgi:cellulose synthase/poly-beta-1,6-N-acetylglucosamine synthase-like glycosyltransferase